MSRSCWSPFGGNKIPSRWAIMTACLLFMCLSGTCYAFGLISETIKDRYNLTQTKLDIIATMGRFGSSSTIIAGIFNNRYGPSISVWFGVVIITLGWGLLTIFTTQIINISSLSYSYIIIGICNFIYLHGTVWWNGIAAPCIAQNFPKKDHGKVLGLAKGYLGAGSAFIAIWKTDLANNDVNVFMFEYLIFLPIFGLIFGWYLMKLPKEISKAYIVENELNSKGIANYKPWYILAIIFVLYSGIVSIVQVVYNINIYIQIVIFIFSQIIWLLPWLLAIFCHGPFFLYLDNDKLFSIQNENISKLSSDDDDEYNIGMPHIFCSIEYWLLYIPFIIVTGSGLSFIANIAQIIESASSTQDDDNKNTNIVTSLVTIISVGNFMSRIIVGYLSDHYRDKFHRVFWMMFSCIGMSISTLFVYFIDTSIISLFFIAAICIGFCHGWIFSVVIASCSDLWGTRYLSGNYAALDSSSVIGQLLFSNLIFANLYELQHKSINGDNTKCFGDKCYKYTFLICSISCIVAFIMTFILWIIVKNKKNNQKYSKLNKHLIDSDNSKYSN